MRALVKLIAIVHVGLLPGSSFCGSAASTVSTGDVLDVDTAHETPKQPRQLRARQLKERLHALQSELGNLGFLRSSIYSSLCPSLPCPLGLALEDVRVVTATGPVKRFAISPPPGGASLNKIYTELSQRLQHDARNPHTPASTVSYALPGAGSWEIVGSKVSRGRIEIQVCQKQGALKSRLSSMAFGLRSSGLHQHNSPEDGGDALDKLDDPLENLTRSVGGNKTAAEIAGVKANSASDLAALISSLVLHSSLVMLCFLIFGALYQTAAVAPVLQANAQPDEIPKGMFGWVSASYHLTIDDISQRAGLDQAMMVEFCQLAVKTFALIGVPQICILCPLHYIFGGGAAGDDVISWFGIHNVVQGSWLYWVHAGVVWYVVVVVERLMIMDHAKFCNERRQKWMREMRPPRLTTVLVDRIPRGDNTDEALKRYFDEQVFGREVVSAAHVVKDTRKLNADMKVLATTQHQLQREQMFKPDSSKLPGLQEKLKLYRTKVATLREEMDSDASLNTDTGFVTFYQARECIIAKKIFSPLDDEAVIVTSAPDPSDIIWEDLVLKPEMEAASKMLGMFLVVVVFFITIPVTIVIASIATYENLASHITAFQIFATQHTSLPAVWDGIVGSVVLSQVMGFAPTVLMAIFSNLLVLKSKGKSQLLLQRWYFQFQVIFVLLITSIGASLIAVAKQIIDHPATVFTMLAKNLPQTSNFYTSYVILQWVSHAMVLLRYVNLAEFAYWKNFYGYDDARAKELSEPEDQDYHGIGARCARNVLIFVVVLCFCTLSPFIAVFGIVNFCLCRLIYSYLAVYAETKKTDLGGRFWVSSCEQILEGLCLYAALMTGVLSSRAASPWPSVISASSFVYLIYAWRHFHADYRWRVLEFKELPSEFEESHDTAESYKQPDLPPPLRRTASGPEDGRLSGGTGENQRTWFIF